MKMKDVVKKWNLWAVSRNEGDVKVPLIEDLLKVTSEELVRYLTIFIAELQKGNGERFSKKALIRILSQINTYLRSIRNDSGDSFKRELSIGMRRISKEIQAVPPRMITAQMERVLWEKSILDTESNKGLSYAMFFYNVKIFGLTSVTDHKKLKCNAFEFSENAFGKYVQLNCDVLQSENLPCKIIHYEDVENARSYYKLLQKYLDAISRCETNYFYVKPLYLQSKGFTNKVFGIKALSSYISDMMMRAGYEGKYTNESLRACFTRRSATSGHSFLMEISKKLDPPLLEPVTTSPITQPITGSPITQPTIASPITQPITASPITQPIIASPVTQPIKMETSDRDFNNNMEAISPTMIQACNLTITLKGSFNLSLANLLPPGTTVKPKGVQIVQQTEGQVTVKMDLEPSK